MSDNKNHSQKEQNNSEPEHQSEHRLIQQRIEKLEAIRNLKINPYPYKYIPKHQAKALQDKYQKLDKEQKTNDKVKIAGRILTMRDMGKIQFGHIQDETGKIQVYMRKDELEKSWPLVKKLDLGDIIGVGGTIFKTKTGEISIWVKKIDILCKSIRPLPEKYHGLKDPEARYRNRAADMIMNPEVSEVFKKRALILKYVREFLNKKGFIEVDIPTLQSVYGGAAARPFTTKMNALNQELYLSISPELYLKRLVVGGLNKVYFMGKNFRNEDIDRTHNPEFTAMECYQAYADYKDMMKLTESIFEYTAKKLYGKTKIKYQEKEIEFKKPWKRITVLQSLKEYADLNIKSMSDEEVMEKCIELNLEVTKETSRGQLVIELFEKIVEPNLIQPTFVTDYPKEASPLCKEKRGSNEFIEKFEPYINGWEIGNAYSELNNPLIQKQLFEEQAKLGRAGNEEYQPYDEDFIRDIEQGMPPTGGLGIGIDRMIILLTNSQSIRDVIPFPFMKNLGMEKENNKTGKSKETKIAIAIINKAARLEPWQRLNTIAHLNAAFGARTGRKLFLQDKIKTKDGKDINLNIQHAIMIKEANNNAELLQTIEKAKEMDLEIAEFTREMMETTDDKKVISITENKNKKEVEYLGVLLFGKRHEVESITKNFPLYK